MASSSTTLRFRPIDALPTVRFISLERRLNGRFNDHGIITIEADDHELDITAPLDHLEAIANQIKAAVIAERARLAPEADANAVRAKS